MIRVGEEEVVRAMTVSAVVGGVTATYIQSGGGRVSAIAVQ